MGILRNVLGGGVVPALTGYGGQNQQYPQQGQDDGLLTRKLMDVLNLNNQQSAPGQTNMTPFMQNPNYSTSPRHFMDEDYGTDGIDMSDPSNQLAFMDLDNDPLSKLAIRDLQRRMYGPRRY